VLAFFIALNLFIFSYDHLAFSHHIEVYMAVYKHLGATACRILVPGYSEIYLVED
jgi:ribosomal protein S12 methylthiotransferase accessory factor YcaO